MASPAAVLAIAVEANTTQANAALARTQGQLSATAAKANASSAAIRRSLLGVGAVAVGAGVALFKIGQNFDDAYDTIRTKTGATGKHLRGLQRDFKAVVKDVPTDFGTAATAIAGLNQRLGLTGKPLEKLTKQVIQLSKITGTDVQENVEAVTRLFQDWGVKTGQQSGKLDELYRVSENTGASVSDLSRLMVQFGTPLRQLGFSFEETGAMFGQFEQQGVNMQTLLPGLRMGLNNLAQPTSTLSDTLKKLGIDSNSPKVELTEIFKAIKDAPSKLEATGIAAQVFGKRASGDMAGAIRESRFDFQDLMDVMEKGRDTISNSERSTRDFSEQWTLFKNNMEVAILPIARKVFKAISSGMRQITDIVSSKKLTWDEKLQKLMDLFVGWLGDLASKAGQMAPKVAVAFVKGFINADIWGKIGLSLLLIRVFGGKGAIRALGAKIGTWIGTRLATTVAAETTATEMLGGKGKWTAFGTRLGGWIGPALGAASAVGFMVVFRNQIEDKLHSMGITLPGQTVPGTSKSGLNNPRSIEDVARNAFGAFGGSGGSPVSDKVPKYLKSIRSGIALTIKKYGDLMDIEGRWGFGARQTYRQAAQDAKKYGQINQNQLEFLTHAFDKNADLSSDDMRRLARIVGLSSKDIRDQADKTKDKVSDAAAKQASNVGDSYGNLVHAAKTGMDTLRDNTNRALAALGLNKPVQFRTNEAPLGKGGVGHRAGAQRGAVIPGTGNGDTVPVMAEPGEGFINKTAVKALGGPKAINAINAAIPRFAQGGTVGGDTAGLVAPFLGALHSMSGATHTPINVLSGYRSRAEQARLYQLYLSGQGNLAAAPGTSHHELGIAADISPGRETFGGVAGKFGMGFTVPSESWHIELLNAAAGKFGAGPQKIARIILQGPKGSLTSMGQASLDKTRNAANAYIRRKWQSMGQLNFTGGGGQFSKPELISLWKRVNGGLGDPNLMAAIALAESGGNPNAHNPSGASGLWQILGQLVPGNIFDPVVNAKNAAAKLRTQGLSAWEVYTNGSYAQYLRKGGMVMPPFGGSFGSGGVVPGPTGAPRTIVAHGGERVGGDVQVNVSFANGMEWLREFVNVEIDDREHHRRQIARMG